MRNVLVKPVLVKSVNEGKFSKKDKGIIGLETTEHLLVRFV